jgi:hypothetical protein
MFFKCMVQLNQHYAHSIVVSKGMVRICIINPANVGLIFLPEGRSCTTGKAYVTLNQRYEKESQLSRSKLGFYFLFSPHYISFSVCGLINYVPKFMNRLSDPTQYIPFTEFV